MNLDPVGKALYETIERELPPYFTYHSAAALRAHIALGQELALAAGLTETQTQAVCWALIGHTIGWLYDYDNPFTEGPQALAEMLEELDAAAATAQLAVRLLAELPQQPRHDDPAAEVLADTLAADLADEQLYLRWACRAAEWECACPPRSLVDWYNDLHDLVAQTAYCTPTARARFDAHRLARLAELNHLLGRA